MLSMLGGRHVAQANRQKASHYGQSCFLTIVLFHTKRKKNIQKRSEGKNLKVPKGKFLSLIKLSRAFLSGAGKYDSRIRLLLEPEHSLRDGRRHRKIIQLLTI